MTDSTNAQYTMGKDTQVTVLAKTETKISFMIKKKNNKGNERSSFWERQVTKMTPACMEAW